MAHRRRGYGREALDDAMAANPETFNVDTLLNLANGQRQGSILLESQKNYMSKVSVMFDILWNIQGIDRAAVFHCVKYVNGEQICKYHTGEARNIRKLRYPHNVDYARMLFAHNANEIFDLAFQTLIGFLYPNEPDKRGGDLVLSTLYERWRKTEFNNVLPVN